MERGAEIREELLKIMFQAKTGTIPAGLCAT